MGQQFNINSLTIFKGTGYYNSSGDKNGHFNLPIICSSGDIISTDNGSGARFTGILTDQNVSPITFTGNYTIPSGKKLVILNYYSDDGGILNVDGVDLLNGCFNLHIGNSSASPTPAYMSIKIPLIFNANSQINQTTGSTDVINGYLVDENYFSNSGGGFSGSGNMIVSTFGDTLTLNGQSIIVPGISFSNVVPTFDSITDIDGNTYLTVAYGDTEWMTENLTTTTYSDGTSISHNCSCS